VIGYGDCGGGKVNVSGVDLKAVIPAKAGLRRQDAGANIGEADGPKGAPQERCAIQ